MTQPSPSQVVILDPDPRAARQLQFGFRREGVRATTLLAPSALAELGAQVGLVIVGGDLALVATVRALIDDQQLDVSLLFTGEAPCADAEAAGADEVLARPAYLRDVVTIGRLLQDIAPEARGHIIGNLGELTNVLALVRALAALGRSATLTLMRGLRRGEVRFFHGEVTSAQVGLIHGQAALHQLLLWTDARFDFRHEDVVRRQQIPLSHAELFADAERFLEGIKDESGALSPAMVLEQDVQRVHGLGKQIPTEVHGVLRMFDGHRVLADVLEDSPYRVFETLRVAQRAVEAGLLRVVKSQRPKATWRAVLAIEEWLVNTEQPAKDSDTEQDEPEPPASESSPRLPKKKARRPRRQRRANTPLPIPAEKIPTTAATATIDWGALVPRAIGSDITSLSMVVPVAQASGEIRLPTRELERERLEALMDTGKRDKIFPSDLGEPSVVFDDRSGPTTIPAIPTAVPTLAIPTRVDSDAVTSPASSVSDGVAVAIARTSSAQFRDDVQARVRAVVEQAGLARSRLEIEARGAKHGDVRAQLEAEIAHAQHPDEAATTTPIPKAELDDIAREDAAPAPTPVEGPMDEDPAVKRAAEARALADAFAGKTTPTPAPTPIPTPAPTPTPTPPTTTELPDHEAVRADAEARVLADTRAAMAKPDLETIEATAHDATAIAAAATSASTAAATSGASERDEPTNEPTSDELATPRPKAKTAPPIDPPVLVERKSSPGIAVPRTKTDKSGKVKKASGSVPNLAHVTNIATDASAKEIDELRKDAASFSDDEEAFFRGGDAEHAAPVPRAIPIETFEDLDEGYQPVGFWDRLLGRKDKKKK
ncbi:MAG: DUF4388 domain-containing protein [Proteobacteria bacterium]|nr:DUF4388 domain-containing protein [Pseudomonadota bacterium]